MSSGKSEHQERDDKALQRSGRVKGVLKGRRGSGRKNRPPRGQKIN